MNENCELKVEIERLKKVNEVQGLMIGEQKKYYEEVIRNMEENRRYEERYLRVVERNIMKENK